jgi:hypothetical protein
MTHETSVMSAHGGPAPPTSDQMTSIGPRLAPPREAASPSGRRAVCVSRVCACALSESVAWSALRNLSCHVCIDPRSAERSCPRQAKGPPSPQSGNAEAERERNAPWNARSI